MRLSRVKSAIILPAVIALAGAVSLLGPAASANAAPAPAQRDQMRIEMVRIGVDHDVARANGYEIRIDSKGMEYTVTPGTPANQDNAGRPIGIDGTVQGPCGWSWFDWVDIDYWARRASIYSGFEIRPGWQPAVFIEVWDATIADDAGVSTKHLRPTLGWVNNVMVWVSPRHRFTSSVGGYVYGEISAGIVVLRDGTICFSLDPNDSVWLSS